MKIKRLEAIVQGQRAPQTGNSIKMSPLTTQPTTGAATGQQPQQYGQQQQQYGQQQQQQFPPGMQMQMQQQLPYGYPQYMGQPYQQYMPYGQPQPGYGMMPGVAAPQYGYNAAEMYATDSIGSMEMPLQAVGL